jgi:hypothetical protein
MPEASLREQDHPGEPETRRIQGLERPNRGPPGPGRGRSVHFGAPRSKGSSPHVWKMPLPGDPRVNLQRGEGGKAKAYQVRQVLQAIARLLQERKP